MEQKSQFHIGSHSLYANNWLGDLLVKWKQVIQMKNSFQVKEKQTTPKNNFFLQSKQTGSKKSYHFQMRWKTFFYSKDFSSF